MGAPQRRLRPAADSCESGNTNIFGMLGLSLLEGAILPLLDCRSLVAVSASCKALQTLDGSRDALAVAERVAERAVKALSAQDPARWR